MPLLGNIRYFRRLCVCCFAKFCDINALDAVSFEYQLESREII